MAAFQLVDCVCASCGGTTRWPASQAQQSWFCPKCAHENPAARAARPRRAPQESEPVQAEANAAKGKMRSSGECRPLLDAATKSLFRKNAFRITGLRVDATSREVTTHVDKLKLMEELGQGQNAHTGVFALKPPPSLDEIRDALQKLKDPEQRLIDEFFWFWPEAFSLEEPDEGILAVQRGAADQAVAFWSPREEAPTNGVVAHHNLAVLYHLCAVEWESHAIHAEPDETRRRQTEQYWKGSLRRWEGLLADDHFWEILASRIRQIGDARLSTGFARRMRASLPDALNRVNVELALAYAAAGKLDEARRHVRFIGETHRGWASVEKAAKAALAPATARLKHQIKQAKEVAETNPAAAHEATNTLISQAQPLLDIFDLFFGEEEHSEKDLLDETATACVNCSVAYQRKTGDNTTFLSLLERTLPLADSVEVRRDIEGFIGKAKRNLAYANLKTIQDTPAHPKAKLQRLRAEVVPLLEDLKKRLGASSESVTQLSDSVAIALRGISIEAYNNHQDFTTALDAIQSAQTHAQDPELKRKISEDVATVRQAASPQYTVAVGTPPLWPEPRLSSVQRPIRTHAFHALIQRNRAPLIIDNKGIRSGPIALETQDVEGVQWGVYSRTVNGFETERSFSLCVATSAVALPVGWNKRGIIAATCSLFRKQEETIPITEMPSDRQEAIFENMIDAVLHNLVPSLVRKLLGRIQGGQDVQVGPCTLSCSGVAFHATGLFTAKDCQVPWPVAETQMSNGQVIVSSREDRKSKVYMEARSTYNAVLLPILCSSMRGQTTF